jgi:thymidine kinase
MGIATNKRYKRLDCQIRCECGQPATRQARIQQIRLLPNGRLAAEAEDRYMPLCEACYQEHLQIEHERGALV